MTVRETAPLQVGWPPPRLPSESEVQQLVRDQRQSAVVLAVVGLLVSVVSMVCFSNALEYLGMLLLLAGGWTLVTCYGRIWSMGGPRLSRWEGAKASLWVVTHTEVGTDSDDDAVWYYLRIASCEGRRFWDSAALHEGARGLDVRLCPRRLSTTCDWVGKYLIRMRATDGTDVVHVHGNTRLYRASASPWDWLVDR